MESELEDLTTSLFEEANKMVYEANFKQDRAEKKLAVAEGKVNNCRSNLLIVFVILTSLALIGDGSGRALPPNFFWRGPGGALINAFISAVIPLHEYV